MLTGDYLCFHYMWKDRGSDPQCRLCPSATLVTETIPHILVACHGTNESRSKIWPELLNILATVSPMNKMLGNSEEPEVITQFILDCTSLNLPNDIRISSSTPGASRIFEIARQYCYAIHSERITKLKKLKNM